MTPKEDRKMAEEECKVISRGSNAPSKRGAEEKTLQRKPALKNKRIGSSTITQGITFVQAAAVAKPIKVAIITKDQSPRPILGWKKLVI